MAKKARRARRQQVEKQPVSVPETRTVAAPDNTTASAGQQVKRKTLDFVQEYAYVYTEMRNILLLAILMFAVLIGLSFVI